MTRFFVGIDTGGTYTDAVVIDPDRRQILARAKSVTTKGDLAIGVRNSLSAVLSELGSRIDRGAIAKVAISTTLATNAVVEGHGSACAVVLAGFDDRMVERSGITKSFSDAQIIRVAGGHDHNGAEKTELDINALRDQLKVMLPLVNAVAVASAFAVRNAAHEIAIRDVVHGIDEIPVTLSSELSSELDAPRRALTAVLNARLVSKITQLIQSVRTVMAEFEIQCPLMIVKGDGSLARAEAVIFRPIETVLSGPAASIVGAKWLSQLDDFILSDIGGTTTDVAVLSHGMPRIAQHGAKVGGWQTMVKAVDVCTTGLGGDSEVQIGLNGIIQVGPQRALPLSLLASRDTSLVTMLEADLAETEGGSLLGRFVVLPFGAQQQDGRAGLATRDIEILEQISDRPIPLRRIAVSSAAQRVLQNLRRKGLLQIASFTPSDAAHVLGCQDNWSRSAAELGAKLACRFRDMKLPGPEQVDAFCREVWSIVVERSALAVLEAALPGVPLNSPLVTAVCQGKQEVGLARVHIGPTVPIVAVGGPALVFYPEVGVRLGCDVIVNSDAAVANALGAAAGMTSHRIEIRIEGDGSGVFRIFDGIGMREIGSGGEAIRIATLQARERVARMALAFGNSVPEIKLGVSKSHLPDAIDDEGLLSALVVAEAFATDDTA